MYAASLFLIFDITFLSGWFCLLSRRVVSIHHSGICFKHVFGLLLMKLSDVSGVRLANA